MAATRHSVGRRTAKLAAQRLAIGATRNDSSFIKQVMEQVKKDMENDDRTKKDWEKAQQSSAKFREQADRYSDRLSDLGENLKSASAKTSQILSDLKETARVKSEEADRLTKDNESLRKARDFIKSTAAKGSESSEAVFSKTKDVFSGVMDSTSKVFRLLGDENTKAERTKKWKASKDQAGAAEQPQAAQPEQAAESSAPPEPESALVVSEAHSSTWDRFGAGLRDMPFLSSAFENPLFDRLFGESEIAASIREMKDIDYSFRLEDFAEDIEYVVAPHIIRTYLEGDQEALKVHCGEAAFAAVDASIKSRKQQQMSLDTNILAGPTEIELKGAKLMDKGPPCFIWTFNMQQVNCLRDKNDEIIEGAIDDIRTVCYALVVTRHPEIDLPAVEYPWQISELAILWNQKSF